MKNLNLWNFFVLERSVILWWISVEFRSKAGWDISSPSTLTIFKYLKKMIGVTLNLYEALDYTVLKKKLTLTSLVWSSQLQDPHPKEKHNHKWIQRPDGEIVLQTTWKSRKRNTYKPMLHKWNI